MKERKAIKEYFDEKGRTPCRVGHLKHTNSCPHCVSVHGYKIDKTDNRLWGRFKGRKQ